ncbi:MAG: hypothetical protein J0J15_11020 [Mesorhizobium sp.]|nr:hypothetical protein [Mesorhizobium sp.]
MIERSTLIVEGLLALRMHRLAAARAGTSGREIITIPLLAARLAGGFVAPVGTDILYPVIQKVLASGGFRDIGPVAGLPGMPRAVLQSLDAAWRADIDLSSLPGEVTRFADLYLLETRIREQLPPSRRLPRDLRDDAIARVSLSKLLLGRVTLSGIVEIDTVWRPLLNAIAQHTEVVWNLPAHVEHSWFNGATHRRGPSAPARLVAEVSADPKSEVVEAQLD